MFKKALPLIFILASASFTLGATFEYSAGPTVQSQNPARWNRRVIPISVSRSLLAENSFSNSNADPESAVRAALKTWERVAGVSFIIQWTDVDAVSSAQGRGDRRNLITISPTAENLLMFSGEASVDAARTRLFLDRRGQITEADIVLNPYQQFSTDGTFGTFDLQAVLTHELGHLLGLGHSPVLGATLYDRIAKNGTFGKVAFGARTLSQDDLSAIRGLYDAESKTCCGSLSGKIDSLQGQKTVVWLEESETGRVVASRYVDSTGWFRFDGIEQGSYLLRIDSPREGPMTRSFLPLFDGIPVEITKSANAFLKTEGRSVRRSFGTPVSGFDGQFAPIAMSIESSSDQGRVILGAQGSFAGGPVVGSTSRLVEIVGFQLLGGRSIAGMTVIGVDFRLDGAAPLGDYTLTVSDASGARSFLIGGLSLESEFSALPNSK